MPIEPNSLPVNIVDVVIVGILLVSGAIAFLFGFIRELFLIAAFITAAVATYFGFGYLQHYARAQIAPPLIADVATALTIFLVTLIAVVLVGVWLSRGAKKIGLGALDRSLGFLYGLARGGLVVSIVYLFVGWPVPPDEHPEWLRNARAVPLLDYGASILVLTIPEEYRPQRASAHINVEGTAGGQTTSERLFETFINPPPPAEEEEHSGYRNAQRKDMDRLIESTQ